MVLFEAGLVLLALVAVAKYAGVVKGAEKAYNLVLSGAVLTIAAAGTGMIAATTLTDLSAIAPLSDVLSLVAGIVLLVGGVFAAYKYLVA
ncbi:hypothetical protein CL614_01615 [archaeon]|nr:hypothetical protein [archaeon]|tara:strand:- start:763 stop:1032 length:270 start_codon:yes stop_codon:yes gene_type:complete